jgi:hypothetical protein
VLDGPGDTKLEAVFNGLGLADADKDGLLEHGTDTATMWQADQPGLTLEFTLPDTVPLSAVEVWNYNAEWRSAEGIRKADVSVSADGVTWKRVLTGPSSMKRKAALITTNPLPCGWMEPRPGWSESRISFRGNPAERLALARLCSTKLQVR